MTLLDLFTLAADAPASPNGPAPNPLIQFAPIILMFVIFYFILIRPQRKRQKELEAKVAALRSGDKVITAGGIHGLVTNVKDRTLIIKVADNTKIEFEKSAVQSVTKKKDASGSDDNAGDQPDDDKPSS